MDLDNHMNPLNFLNFFVHFLKLLSSHWFQNIKIVL